MPFNQISSKTFCERMHGCSFYKENDSYAKIINILFHRVLKIYSLSSSSFLSVFVEYYNSKSFTGTHNICSGDRERFDEICTVISINMNNFFLKYPVKLISSKYLFKGRLTGSIGGVVSYNKEVYTIDFSFYDLKDTLDNMYWHHFNISLYNKTNNITNDGLIYVPMVDDKYLIKYNSSDYTIKRGFIPSIINNRSKRPSSKCFTCSVKNCRPRLVIRKG